MTEGKFRFGESVPVESVVAVALDWNSTHLHDGSLHEALPRVSCESGVYAIEGCHDASPNGGILYIGRAGVLRERLAKSLESVWRVGEDGKMRLHSDVWSIVLRWAVVRSDLLESVEGLLITAHSPNFNSQSARRQADKQWKNMLVLNAGQKGRLLPVVYGAYLHDDFWPDSTA
jgi:hypothetical protein